METTNFPFEMRESKFVPGLVMLAVKVAKVTWVGPVETRVSQKTGETFKMVQVNLQITVPGASHNVYLHANAMHGDAQAVEDGRVKTGDMVTCLVDLDTHSWNGRTYQDVTVREMETVQIVGN